MLLSLTRPGGKPHVLANEGEAGVFDGNRAAADVGKIVAEAARFWGGLPYERYAFINVLSETGGGLEHKDSTVLMASRWATGTRRAYVNWLTLAAHEHFHAWNVKRLRPIELGPFDYERENPTTSLWICSRGLRRRTGYKKLICRSARSMSRDRWLRRRACWPSSAD